MVKGSPKSKRISDNYISIKLCFLIYMYMVAFYILTRAVYITFWFIFLKTFLILFKQRISILKYFVFNDYTLPIIGGNIIDGMCII